MGKCIIYSPWGNWKFSLISLPLSFIHSFSHQKFIQNKLHVHFIKIAT